MDLPGHLFNTHMQGSKSILRKESGVRSQESEVGSLLKLEKALIVKLEQYSTIVEQAATEHNPSVLGDLCF